MLCPKDNVVCNPLFLQDVEVCVCSKCQGVWMEQTAVRKLIRHLAIPEYSDVDEALKNWGTLISEGTAPRDFWQEGKLTCPKEGAQMQKHYFAGSHIGVDHCLFCKGFWFDGGELQAIAELAKPDPARELLGLEMARFEGQAVERKMNALRPADSRVPLDHYLSSVLLGNAHPAFAIMSVVSRLLLDWLRAER